MGCTYLCGGFLLCNQEKAKHLFSHPLIWANWETYAEIDGRNEKEQWSGDNSSSGRKVIWATRELDISREGNNQKESKRERWKTVMLVEKEKEREREC